MASSPREPALGGGHLDEGANVAFQVAGAEGLLEVADDARHGGIAVAALHDLAGAAVELHHPLGVEQHEAVLYRLPLQPKAGADAWAALQAQLAHAFTPYFSAIASFMAHRMSSLNCSTSSARSCCTRVTK